MWDPDQLAAIEVEIDRLLLAGEPLGEWLAVRMRLDAGPLGSEERARLRQRAAILRERLGHQLVLADDPALGRPAAIRERGLLVDIGFDAATPGRLATLLARPDARFLLRLRLRGVVDTLLGCADMLLDRRAAARPAWLRLLDFELPSAGELDGKDPDAEAEAARIRLIAGLLDRRPALLASLGDLFSLTVDDHPLQLDGSDAPGKRRTALGRALADPDPDTKRLALEAMVGDADLASALRVPLIRLITREADPELRKRALQIIRGGRPAPESVARRMNDHDAAERTSLIALLGEWARDHEDSDLREWLDGR